MSLPELNKRTVCLLVAVLFCAVLVAPFVCIYFIFDGLYECIMHFKKEVKPKKKETTFQKLLSQLKTSTK